ncbi:MAG: pyridoxamine 5'-phosphate oxidase family protein [Candidatus Nitrotoga sp.]
MGKQYTELSEQHTHFIKAQKIYFVGTATADSRVNVSPKGMDSLRVLDCRHVAWLNVTGSGNETAAHVQQNPRMTIMFCALAGAPLILRLYGSARVIHQNDDEWDALYARFKPLPGARQIFYLTIDLVQTSCGMGVPFYDFVAEREQLNEWADKKGEAGIRQYWLDKNQVTIDAIPTYIADKNF